MELYNSSLSFYLFFFILIISFLYCNCFCVFCFVFRHALNVQIFIKMHRSDYAERQLRTMQQIDEDHTLTQLANAWLDLAVVLVNLFIIVVVIRN